MQNDDSNLIITSAINPSKNVPFLKIRDPNQRLFETYCCLTSWIIKTKIKKIIICDNTGIDHDFNRIKKLAEKYQKKFEILIFNGDHEKVAAQGKGFGEGEIMEHVMANSRLLKQDASFYKITGKAFIDNFNSIYRKSKNKKVVFNLEMKWWKKIVRRCIANSSVLSSYFQRLLIGRRVPTYFYKCSKKYYINFLKNCHHQVNDFNNYYLEHSFYLPLIKNGYYSFKEKPRIVGYTASQGILFHNIDYSDEIKRKANEFLYK